MNQDTVQLDSARVAAVPPDRDTLQRPGVVPADLERAEAGLAVLLEAWQRTIEELGAMLPPAQVRALLVIDAADDLNITGLARTLGASPSATSRLCDRLVAAGLVARVPAVASRREMLLELTESGQRLAAWIGDQRRTALIQVMEAISPGGRADLARGLSELLLR
ncbi:MAG: MarR family transcriptional regulator [Candidatus Dormibacteraeota bacterium]|nr:MarR family transcriptional regulator [Candidatus Dormibacteraeota bacterium]